VEDTEDHQEEMLDNSSNESSNEPFSSSPDRKSTHKKQKIEVTSLEEKKQP
jgi:hypothetical protein